MGGGEIVIDLGPARPGPPIEPSGPPSAVVVRRWRSPVAVLAGILVLSAGGAAAFSGPPLRPVHTVPFSGPGDLFSLGDELLVTVTPADEAERPGRRITGYDLTDRRQLWSTDYPPEGLGMTLANGSLLIPEESAGQRPGQRFGRTTALDPRTGQRRWSQPYWPQTLPGEPTALVYDSVPASTRRPGSDPSTGRSVGTEPPTRMTVRAIDIETGRPRWESPQLDAAVLVPAAGDRPTVLLIRPIGGDVEVRDVATGAVRHRLDWPGGDPAAAALVGDVVAVVRAGSDPGVTAYSADLRRMRWSRSLTGPNPFVEACGPVLCQPDTSGTVAFAPATGEILWRLDEQIDLRSTGSRLIEVATNQRLRRIIDPLTGRAVGDLGGWRLADADGLPSGDRIPAGQPPLVLKPNQVKQQTEIGLLDLARPSVRPLGVLPYILRGCSVVGRFMACRTTDGQLRVWRYG